jgi:hypothetical protein
MSASFAANLTSSHSTSRFIFIGEIIAKRRTRWQEDSSCTCCPLLKADSAERLLEEFPHDKYRSVREEKLFLSLMKG